ncbi:hypothetical protein E2C01_014512 [Portunus trituberculatus]|uniref:Uncharacterized protein n=1 Tax=Portunus trituberculatus TaxID=210409 RepID=A0A5B7DK51_PORTR|nr:hypothetical protein [Portunus trituberculatus]
MLKSPVLTSREMMRAVRASHSSDSATKSPNEDIRSAPLALAGTPTAAPAGDTCLKEAAAGRLRAALSSLTSCQAFRASHRLMKPGEPFTTERNHINIVLVMVWSVV